MGGLPPGLPALPSIDVTNLGSKFSGMFSSLTESMTNFKDAASAETALPKLKDFNDQIDVAKGAMENRLLSPFIQAATAGGMWAFLQ